MRVRDGGLGWLGLFAGMGKGENLPCVGLVDATKLALPVLPVLRGVGIGARRAGSEVRLADDLERDGKASGRLQIFTKKETLSEAGMPRRW